MWGFMKIFYLMSIYLGIVGGNYNLLIFDGIIYYYLENWWVIEYFVDESGVKIMLLIGFI